MKKIFLFLLIAAIVGCTKDNDNQDVNPNQEPAEEIVETPVFVKQTYNFSGTEYPFQKAVINPQNGVAPKVVIYLHGGTSKGGDNEKQMLEPGIDSIFNYLKINKITSIFIVPQCPEKSSDGKMCDWVKMSNAVEFLLKSQAESGSKFYVFGGSMGGTGTWNLLSQFPGFFSGAMPCAGNPKGCNAANAANVAKTPVYAVMGGSDRIMKPDEVKLQDFLDQLKSLGGDYFFDSVPDWDHEKTCTLSYTSERIGKVLGW